MAPTKFLVLFLAAWAGCPILAHADEKSPPVKEKAADGSKRTWLRFQQIHDLLEEPLDMKLFQNPNTMTLKNFLELLAGIFAEKGKNLPIIVNRNAFKEMDPDAEDVMDSVVTFEKFPQRMKTSTALRQALLAVKTNNATWLIRNGHVEITARHAASPERLSSGMVMARFDKQPLQEALAELSEITGATIVLDGRVGDKAKTAVTADFKNTITLESAVRLLAEMADLQLVVDEDTLFVTSKPKEEVPGKKSTLRLRDRRLDRALKDLATWAAVRIFFDPLIFDDRDGLPSVCGKNIPKVTIRLEPYLSAEVAIKLVADGAGLEVVRLGDVYHVTTPDQAKRLKESKEKK